jgi:hypothetical protein
MLICLLVVYRYKLALFQKGKQLSVLWLYFNKALQGHLSFTTFITQVQISMYLFHILCTTLQTTSYSISNKHITKWLSLVWIKLQSIGISFTFHNSLFGIGLAYNHYVTYRLFVALISHNPVFLLIQLCFKKVMHQSSFYYEYS